jgi:fructose-1-phosphate kinase PfkB-like protein
MLFKRFSVSVDFHRIDGPTRSVFLVTVSNEKAEIVSPGFELIRRTLKVH